MKKTFNIFALALIIFVGACKNDPPDFSNIGNISDSYQPVTKDTYWKYNQTANGATTTQTQTMTGAIATFNNKTYFVVNSVSAALGASTGYFYHGNNSYSMRTIAQGFSVEYVYLKDNYAAGKTWTEPMTPTGDLNGVPAQVIGKITESGITKTVSGKEFKNVIHTQLTIQYDMGTGFETMQTQDYYIAKGVGIIELDSTTDSFGITITTTSVITDYAIK